MTASANGTSPVVIGSTFTGAGGLDMAMRMLWPDHRLAWFSEVDDHAATVFSHHHPDVPNLGDITAIDWTDVEAVDVLVGGFPCQDISHAGKRAGISKETRSGLWFRLLDAALHLRPRLLLVENVAAITSAGGGLDVVLGSLAEVGWDAEWTCLRASDIGAPHQRERWFAICWDARDPDSLAWAQTFTVQRRPETLARPEAVERTVGPDRSALLPTPAVNDMGRSYTVEEWDAWTARMKAEHGNGNGHGKSLEIEAQRLLPTPAAQEPGGTVEDHLRRKNRHDGANRITPTHMSLVVQQPDRWGEYEAAINRWRGVVGRPAPDPTDSEGRLSPRFVEWMMGWPDQWTVVAGTSRTQRLKMLGNGVVPLQAAHAYSHLLAVEEVAA